LSHNEKGLGNQGSGGGRRKRKTGFPKPYCLAYIQKANKEIKSSYQIISCNSMGRSAKRRKPGDLLRWYGHGREVKKSIQGGSKV